MSDGLASIIFLPVTPMTEHYSNTEKLTRLGFFTAFAITIYVAENFIPKPFPFMRLGLANIFILILLANGEFLSAVVVTLGKTVIGGFLSATIISPTTILSLGGSLLALPIMYLFLKVRINFSLIGISVIGAIVHNFTQIIIVRLLLIRTNSIFYLTPILIITGIATGIITGYLAHLLMAKLPKLSEI